MAFGPDAGHVLPVLGAVTRERGYRSRLDLVEPGPDPRAVIGLVAGQLHGLDPAGPGIHAQVQLAPGATGLRAMLLDQPLAGPAQAQGGAVDQQVQGPGAPPRSPRPQRRSPAAECRVVRHGKPEAEQGWRMEPISPSVWRSARRNTVRRGSAVRIAREGRVPGLCPPRVVRGRRRAPGRDGVIAEPDRQAPALPQAGVVFGPIGHPVALLGNVVTASGMGLKRHKEFPGIVDGTAAYPTHPARPSGPPPWPARSCPSKVARRPPARCAGSSWAPALMQSRAACAFPSY